MDAYVHLIKDVKGMNYEHFGELLRELRESRNITREQLAQNICTPKQIYRIERGEYEPSLYLLNQLSIKFNVDLNDYFKMYFSSKSIIAFEGIKSINKAVENNDIIAVNTLIKKYENLPDFKQGENLQHILYGKALCAALISQNYPQSLQYCIDGLKIEAPDFSIDNISQNIYSNVGLALLNCMSRNYMALNKLNTGIKILMDMLSVIEGYILESPYPMYQSSEFSKKIYQNTLYNLSVHLLKLGEIKNALNYVNKGIDFSLKEYNLRFLPELLFIKFRLLYRIENYTESKEYYHQAKNLLIILNQPAKLAELEETVSKEYPLLLQ